MAKRSATNELTHENWCDEEEPETAGVFKRASAEAMKDRTFRTARRRGVASTANDPTGSEEQQPPTKGIFAGFTGFKKTETTSPKAVFSFLAATPNGSSVKADSASKGTTSESSSSSVVENEKKPVNGVDSGSDSSVKSNEYYRRLKGLNESVAKWISHHVANNPLIILTPIFRDYEKHLATIQNKDDSKSIETISSSQGFKRTSNDENKDTTEPVNQISSTEVAEKTENKPIEERKTFGSSIFGSTSNSTSTTSATFSFGAAATTGQGQSQFCFGSNKSTAASTPSFSFGSGSTTSPSAGFSFGAGKPFTFSNVASTNTEEKKNEDDDDAEDDTPPKPDHKPVNEEGATYTKRCKVFVKQGKEYSDRGIGNLFLKPVDGGKTQLIVRADTSLGNVLLNILVVSSLPVQRIGTNNVAVVCIPTPESQPPPVTVLLRVKTSSDADELFTTLQKHMKEAA